MSAGEQTYYLLYVLLRNNSGDVIFESLLKERFKFYVSVHPSYLSWSLLPVILCLLFPREAELSMRMIKSFCRSVCCCSDSA